MPLASLSSSLCEVDSSNSHSGNCMVSLKDNSPPADEKARKERAADSSNSRSCNSTKANSSSAEEDAWKERVADLDNQIVIYQGKGEKATEEDARNVVDSMRKLGSSHPDPRVKKEWDKKAKAFEKATPAKRKSMLSDIGKGLLILLATPFLLAGAAIFASGGILYGVGLLLKGLGNVLTGGTIENMNSDEDDSQETSKPRPE